MPEHVLEPNTRHVRVTDVIFVDVTLQRVGSMRAVVTRVRKAVAVGVGQGNANGARPPRVYPDRRHLR